MATIKIYKRTKSGKKGAYVDTHKNARYVTLGKLVIIYQEGKGGKELERYDVDKYTWTSRKS